MSKSRDELIQKFQALVESLKKSVSNKTPKFTPEIRAKFDALLDQDNSLVNHTWIYIKEIKSISTDVNAKPVPTVNFSFSALHLATLNDDKDFIRYLLEKGAMLSPEKTFTPVLNIAVRYLRPAIFEVLMEKQFADKKTIINKPNLIDELYQQNIARNGVTEDSFEILRKLTELGGVANKYGTQILQSLSLEQQRQYAVLLTNLVAVPVFPVASLVQQFPDPEIKGTPAPVEYVKNERDFAVEAEFVRLKNEADDLIRLIEPTFEKVTEKQKENYSLYEEQIKAIKEKTETLPQPRLEQLKELRKNHKANYELVDENIRKFLIKNKNLRAKLQNLIDKAPQPPMHLKSGRVTKHIEQFNALIKEAKATSKSELLKEIDEMFVENKKQLELIIQKITSFSGDERVEQNPQKTIQIVSEGQVSDSNDQMIPDDVPPARPSTPTNQEPEAPTVLHGESHPLEDSAATNQEPPKTVKKDEVEESGKINDDKVEPVAAKPKPSNRIFKGILGFGILLVIAVIICIAVPPVALALGAAVPYIAIFGLIFGLGSVALGLIGLIITRDINDGVDKVIENPASITPANGKEPVAGQNVEVSNETGKPNQKLNAPNLNQGSVNTGPDIS